MSSLGFKEFLIKNVAIYVKMYTPASLYKSSKYGKCNYRTHTLS